MYSEITEKLFKRIIGKHITPLRTEEREECYKVFYVVDGVVLVSINNYVSAVTQYYVRDINS